MGTAWLLDIGAWDRGPRVRLAVASPDWLA